jgi:hypothetical protein
MTAVSSYAFVNSMGINTHLSYGEYSNFSLVFSRLQSLGIRHIRDGANLGTNVCNEMRQLAAAGIRTDSITAPNESSSVLTDWATCLGSALESYEGPNEYDRSGDGNWVQTLRNYQQNVLWPMRSASIPVIVGPTVTSGDAWTALGDLSNYLDYGNVHDYFASFNPGTPGWGNSDSCGRYGAMTWNMCLAQRTSGNKPIMSTENGWDEAQVSSPAVKARYILRDYLEHWNAGVKRMYLYAMLDDGGQHYGILDGSLNPRPAYTMLQNFIAHIRDSSSSPAPLSLVINGNVHHLLMGRRDGSYQLALWVEAQEWDLNTQAVQNAPPVNVSLRFGRTPSSVTATTYNDAGNPGTQTLNPANATLSVDGHVTVVDIK